jgi:hypothetical protein
MATEFSEIFLGRQACQGVKILQCFRDSNREPGFMLRWTWQWVIHILKHSPQPSTDSLGQVHQSLDSAHQPDWLTLHPKPQPDRGIYTREQGIKSSIAPWKWGQSQSLKHWRIFATWHGCLLEKILLNLFFSSVCVGPIGPCSGRSYNSREDCWSSPPKTTDPLWAICYKYSVIICVFRQFILSLCC